MHCFLNAFSAALTTHRKKILFGAALTLTAGLVTPLATAAEKLKVGYNIWVGSSAVFVAQEQGLFKQAGIDVEFVPFKSPSDTIPALMGGHIDLALTTADNVVLINSQSTSNLKIIYATDTSNGADAVVSKKTIASLRDLKGKTIAVTEGEVNELLLLKALDAAGMKTADVKIVNMDPDAAGAAFVAGKVDAAVTWEPWISRAVSNGKGKVAFSSAQVPNLILDVITVKPSVIRAKGKVISAFLNAVNKGTALLKSNPDLAIPLAAKWLEVTPPEVKNMLGGVKFYGNSDNAALFTDGTAARSLDDISAFFRNRKTITKSIVGREMIDASLIPAK